MDNETTATDPEPIGDSSGREARVEIGRLLMQRDELDRQIAKKHNAYDNACLSHLGVTVAMVVCHTCRGTGYDTRGPGDCAECCGDGWFTRILWDGRREYPIKDVFDFLTGRTEEVRDGGN